MTTPERQSSALAATGNGAHAAPGHRDLKAAENVAQIRPLSNFDARAAREFLGTLAPRGRFTFLTFAEGEIKTNNRLTHVMHGDLKTLGPSLARLNRSGAGVFVTINETDSGGRKYDNITAPRALFLDFDAPDPKRPEWLLAMAGIEPSAIVETSSGRHHVYWATEGMSLEEWDRLQVGLLAAYAAAGADQGVKDRARVMRVPGFWHQKGEPFLSRLVHCSGMRYSPNKLRGWVNSLAGPGEAPASLASSDTVQVPRTEPADPVRGVTLTIAAEALAALPAEHAEEYMCWAKVGMAMHQQFQGGTDAWALWDAWSQRSAKYDDAEATWAKWQTFEANRVGGVSMRSVLHHAEANGWQRPAGVEGAPAAAGEFPDLSALADQPAPAVSRPPLLRPVGELLRHPPQLRWLVKGIMEHPTIGQIFGDPSSGKSFVALDIAASVATGTSWHGHTVTKGPVVYVAGEGYAGAPRRLKAWEIDRELPLEDMPLHVSSGAVEFSSPETVQRLWDELDALEQPVLIVIDTVARAATGWDENSTKDMGMFMSAIEQLARRYDCSVLLVHHTGHGNNDRARGASSIPAALDMSMRLKNRQGVRQLDCTKMKDSEEFTSEHFELRPVMLPPDWLDSEGERMVSAVLVESSRGAHAVIEKPRGTNQVAIFKVANDMQRETLEANSGEAPQLSLADWKRRCANQGIERNRFAEAQEGLLTKGLITIEGDGLKIAPPLFPEARSE